MDELEFDFLLLNCKFKVIFLYKLFNVCRHSTTIIYYNEVKGN